MNVKCCIGNYRKIFKCKPDTWIFNVGHYSNKVLVTRRRESFKPSHVRYNSTPSEAPPIQQKAIPYVKPNYKPDKGGKLLLLIPAITFGLGTWQIKRLKWKTELIQNMEERSKMDPVPLPLDPDEAAKMEFRKVTVTGRFDHSNEVFYGPKPCFVNGDVKRDVIHPSGQESFGYNLVTPFIVSDSGGFAYHLKPITRCRRGRASLAITLQATASVRTRACLAPMLQPLLPGVQTPLRERILINRGWIRTKTIKKKDRPWSNTEGEELTITGVVRLPEKKRSYGPQTDARYNIWHYRDIEDLADKTDCLPIWIDATEEHSIPGKLWGGQTIMAIRNEHLQYIITWYSLSVCTAYMWYVRYWKRI